MKYHGSILDFTHHRNRELMRAYRSALDGCKEICATDVAQKVVETPCDRFWVSEERATIVCAAMMRGEPVLAPMRDTKREMFRDIFRRVMELMKHNPHEKLPALVMQAVNSPAPKFYMLPRSAMEIIYKIKKGFYNKPSITLDNPR